MFFYPFPLLVVDWAEEGRTAAGMGGLVGRSVSFVTLSLARCLALPYNPRRHWYHMAAPSKHTLSFFPGE